MPVSQKKTSTQPPPPLQRPTQTFDKLPVIEEKKPKKSIAKKPQALPKGSHSDMPITEQLISTLKQYSSAKNVCFISIRNSCYKMQIIIWLFH